MSGYESFYKDYPRVPFVSTERIFEHEGPGFKPVPRRHMEDLGQGLLAGDIILLWRVAFGTFTTESVMPKYLEYTYGIDGHAHMKALINDGYVKVMTAFDSLAYINAPLKKSILKEKQVLGLSKLKSADLDVCLREHFTEEVLGTCFTIRGYYLTSKGKKALKSNQAVIDRHPQKKF